MQNLELTGSFVIGGILLITMTTLFYYYMNFSNSKRINEITKTNNIELQKIVNYDFNKVGYRVSGNAVTSIDEKSIVFNADLNNDGSVETISYSFNDNKITREVDPGDSRFTVPYIEDFTITCYDSSNSVTNQASEVAGINVQISFNSQELLIDSTFFSTSYMEKTYYIKN